MAWRHTITLRTASSGANLPGQVVQLYEGATLKGTYSDNGDGTYYLTMTSIGSLIGTIKVNGVTQSEKENIPVIGEDLLDHITEATYNAAGPHASLHGLGSGDGNVVGTTKTQTLTKKTITDADSNLSATRLTSGTLPAARIGAGSIVDSKLAQLTTGDKVAGSAVELGASPGMKDDSGLMIKIPVASYTLYKDGDGLHVKRSATTPGLKVNADGLAVDPTTLAELTTANTVNPSAIRKSWTAPYHFDNDVNLDVAIAAVDAALYRLRIDVENPNSRAYLIYSQSHECARNTGNAEASEVEAAAQYFDGDTTSRRKVCSPFMKTPLMQRVIVRLQFNNSDAYATEVIVKILDSSGAEQYSLTKTETGTDWTTVNAIGNIADLASGLYWVVIYLKSGNVSGTAQMRGVNINVGNEAFIECERADDPAVWGKTSDLIV